MVKSYAFLTEAAQLCLNGGAFPIGRLPKVSLMVAIERGSLAAHSTRITLSSASVIFDALVYSQLTLL